MTFYFFDSSALVKSYATEPGSVWVRELIEQKVRTGEPRHTITIAEITRVEVAAGLAVIERIGRITRDRRDREYRRFISQLMHRYAVIQVTSGDFERAAGLTQRHPLKAYDAVQLAVAIRQHEILLENNFQSTFVSGDTMLLDAARDEGLTVDNPFDHVAASDTN